MNIAKQLALTGYYWASLPSRRRATVERAQRGTEPVQVLFYHRIADEHPNDWTMSARQFARQVSWLQSRFDIVGLDEAQRRITSGINSRPTVCITFDDGYGDNMRFAVPMLLERRIPFTYFVSTEHVLGGKPFPHDVCVGRPLLPNTIDDLRFMVAAGVEIGGHTRTHADCGRLDHDGLVREIAGAKQELENAIDHRLRFFAFPYGLYANLSTEAFAVAYDAGFQGVCSAYGGYNLPCDDPFHLQRIHADPEFIRFKNWLSVDPRKLRGQEDFVPGDYKNACSEMVPC